MNDDLIPFPSNDHARGQQCRRLQRSAGNRLALKVEASLRRTLALLNRFRRRHPRGCRCTYCGSGFARSARQEFWGMAYVVGQLAGVAGGLAVPPLDGPDDDDPGGADGPDTPKVLKPLVVTGR
jgi:hypothetical protein